MNGLKFPLRWSLLGESQIYERNMLLCQRLSRKAHYKRRIDLMKYVYDADCHHDALYSQADEYKSEIMIMKRVSYQRTSCAPSIYMTT